MIPDINRLEHMLACEQIILFTAVDFSVYMASLKKQAAAARYFEILGDAASRISVELRDSHPEIPWHDKSVLRNILIHDYVKVDYNELWKTAKNDVPNLRCGLQLILDTLRPQPSSHITQITGDINSP